MPHRVGRVNWGDYRWFTITNAGDRTTLRIRDGLGQGYDIECSTDALLKALADAGLVTLTAHAAVEGQNRGVERG